MRRDYETSATRQRTDLQGRRDNEILRLRERDLHKAAGSVPCGRQQCSTVAKQRRNLEFAYSLTAGMLVYEEKNNQGDDNDLSSVPELPGPSMGDMSKLRYSPRALLELADSAEGNLSNRCMGSPAKKSKHDPQLNLSTIIDMPARSQKYFRLYVTREGASS